MRTACVAVLLGSAAAARVGLRPAQCHRAAHAALVALPASAAGRSAEAVAADAQCALLVTTAHAATAATATAAITATPEATVTAVTAEAATATAAVDQRPAPPRWLSFRTVVGTLLLPLVPVWPRLGFWTIPLIAGLLNWATNILAVRMMFYPLQFRGMRIGRMPIGWHRVPETIYTPLGFPMIPEDTPPKDSNDS